MATGVITPDLKLVHEGQKGVLLHVRLADSQRLGGSAFVQAFPAAAEAGGLATPDLPPQQLKALRDLFRTVQVRTASTYPTS
jgi:translation initiation factor 6 (eIF-6)